MEHGVGTRLARSAFKIYLGLAAVIAVVSSVGCLVGSVFSSDLRGQLLLRSEVIEGVATGEIGVARCGRNRAATAEVAWNDNGTRRTAWLPYCGVSPGNAYVIERDLPHRGDPVRAQATQGSDTLHEADKDNIYLTLAKAVFLFPALVIGGFVGIALLIGAINRRRQAGPATPA